MTFETSIPLSKKKACLYVALCLLLVAGGWLLFAFDAKGRSVGLMSMIIFGALLPGALIKLFDKSPGLQFLDEGLVENTNMFSVGLIAWEDIAGLEVRVKNGVPLAYLVLHNPKKYISRCGPIKRAVLLLAREMGPSPVTISNTLQMNFPDVLALVERNLAQRRPA